jgi:hypothetical protein
LHVVSAIALSITVAHAQHGVTGLGAVSLDPHLQLDEFIFHFA